VLEALIIGGGVSGLAAARFLRARGLNVEVWEAAGSLGGWARTEPWGEGILEPGAQVLFRAPGSALDRLLNDLNLPVEPLLGKRWVTKGDAALLLPGRTAQWMTSPLLPLAARLRVAVGLWRKPSLLPGESMESAARARFGGTFADDLLPALAAGLFAAPPTLLAGTLLSVLMDRASGTLVRPSGGMGVFVEALGRGLPLHLNQPLKALEGLAEGGFRCVGEGITTTARNVWLALPAATTAALVEPFAPGPAADLRSIRFLDLRFLHSRHRPCASLSGGWSLLCDPGKESGLLGFTCLPGPDGTLQLRCGMGGGYPIDSGLARPGTLENRLRTWFPDLPPALEKRETRADQSMPLPGPEHSHRVAGIQRGMPPGLAWIGAGRFPGGIPGILSGLEPLVAAF
jgi:oxygen-dependent protoporphyrinogen oxidase